ncbi:MAG: non-canonical purine NTP pyrophosphatase [Thermoguttaceae bacterium]
MPLTDMQPVLVLGTGNRKKGLELAELFEPLGLTLKTLADFDNPLDVVENGRTFADNAALKAAQQARHLDVWVLGEDSGLEVDVLGGAPGIYSARFAGAGANDGSNNRLLLEKLAGVPAEKRTARYVCHMTLSDPSGTLHAESEAYCRGRIGPEPHGTHGFGYDPLFQVLEYHRTFAQLGPRAKAVLSHRARAARQLIPPLVALLHSGRW